MLSTFRSKIVLATAGALTLAAATSPVQAQTVVIDQIQHIQAIAPDPVVSGSVILGTHEGVFRAMPNGSAQRISRDTSNFTSLIAHPQAREILFASGHLATKGNLGLLKSADGGVSWSQIATGEAAQAVFHILSVNPNNPDVIYGVFEGIQVSHDGGKTWAMNAPLPEKTFSIVVSSQNSDTLYAGTMSGLSVSNDGGKNWRQAHSGANPVTAVHATAAGRLYLFMYGVGFMVAQESGAENGLQWKLLSSAFQDRVLFEVTVDPHDAQRIFAMAGTGQLMTSGDGGRSWTTFAGYPQQNVETTDKGRALYEDNCAACHGDNGVGERPDDPNARDEFGFVAPAMDDSAHAWHHSNAQLLQTIRDGSPRNERMQAWKGELSDTDINAIIAYVKSLWSFRSLACQGAKHMACMEH